MDRETADNEIMDIHSLNSIRNQIQAVRENESFKKLFDELIKANSPVAKLLLRHPDDLFLNLDPENRILPSEFTIRIPILYWENPLEITTKIQKRPSIAELFEGSISPQEEKEVEEPDEESFIDNVTFQELFLLQLLNLIRSNPQLLMLANKTDEIRLPDVKKVIGQQEINFASIEKEFTKLFDGGNDAQDLKTFIKTILNQSENESDTTYEIRKFIHNFLKELISEGLITIPQQAGNFHRILINALINKGAPFCRRHNQFIQNSYKYSQQEMLEALEFLWNIKLLSPFIINLQCPFCKDSEGKPLNQVLISDISPKDIDKEPRCNWCKKPMIVQAIYCTDQLLNRIISTHDKLLFWTVAYLLEKYELDWKGNINLESEHDFHVKTGEDLYLIECKVFRLSGPIEEDKGFQQKFNKGISQVIDHMEQVDAKSAYFVCYPLPNDKEIIEGWMKQFFSRTNVTINRERIHVIGHDKLEETIRRMAKLK